MSRENLVEFFAKASRDDALRHELRYQTTSDGIIALGTRHGFDITADDLIMVKPADGEPGDDDMDAVSGGTINGMINSVLSESSTGSTLR